MANLTQQDVRGLFLLYRDVMEELRRRDVVRSSNNPVGDYAELLCCKAFGWDRQGNSNKSVDALGPDGTRYQIKARRPTRWSKSRQLGAIRRLKEDTFDFLVGVIFDEDFTVQRACLIPHGLIQPHADFREGTNSWRFILGDDVWSWDGVEDITVRLQAAQED